MKQLFIIVLLTLSACSTPNELRSVQNTEVSPSPSKLVEIDHHIFDIFYDPAIRSPRYVKYLGTKDHLKEHEAKRANHFHADPDLLARGLPYVKPSEYKKSGYDQGHLAPSADFAFSQEANDTTFIMSNMAPQKPQLNRQAWRYLENHVRHWICGEEKVLVITGPIYSAHPQTLASGLEIPDQFFKILVDETPPRKVMAFIYNQTDTTDVYKDRLATIDEIEKKTGLSFNADIPDETKPTLRAPSSVDEWKEDDCK